MPTSRSRLMPIIGLVAALGLAVSALALLLGGDDEQVVVEVDDQGRPLTPRQLAEQDREDRIAAARNEAPGYGLMIRAFEGAGPGFYGDGEVEIDEARRVYTSVMDEVDRLAERRRPLRQKEWREVYRAANDSFTALSMHLDAKDRTQAKELEEAHRRLLQSLAAVRVRGGDKFKLRPH